MTLDRGAAWRVFFVPVLKFRCDFPNQFILGNIGISVLHLPVDRFNSVPAVLQAGILLEGGRPALHYYTAFKTNIGPRFDQDVVPASTYGNGWTDDEMTPFNLGYQFIAARVVCTTTPGLNPAIHKYITELRKRGDLLMNIHGGVQTQCKVCVPRSVFELGYQLTTAVFHPDCRLAKVPVSTLRHGLQARFLPLGNFNKLIMVLADGDNKSKVVHPIYLDKTYPCRQKQR